jgi:hypothetical protein
VENFPLETLIELTETELDAVVGGQVFATSSQEVTATGANPNIFGRVNISITPSTAYVENFVEVLN